MIGGFGEGKACLTDKQVAEFLKHKNGARHVRELINKNIDYFDFNVHILDLISPKLNSNNFKILCLLGYKKQSITQSKNIYVLSHEGFLLYLQFAEVKQDFFNFEKMYFGNNDLKVVKMRYEHCFENILKKTTKNICKFIPQFTMKKNNYRIDFYEENYNLAIEYDEYHHFSPINKKLDKQRQMTVEKELGCKFIRVKKGEELEGINDILTYIFSCNCCS